MNLFPKLVLKTKTKTKTTIQAKISPQDLQTAPIVFLHIPKTAGQTIHTVLGSKVGARNISPIRVHTQVTEGQPQMPPGYGLYSGHIDWTELDTLPRDRFVFTVLRDPYERLASFYFFLLKQAQDLTLEELEQGHRAGLRAVLRGSADDYFFGGDPGFQSFIHNHYDNFYCAYFATRKMLGYKEMQPLNAQDKVQAALANAPLIDRIYSTLDLGALEDDIHARYGVRMSVKGKYLNAGDKAGRTSRWPQLLDRFESDAAIRRLEAFVEADLELIDALGIKV